jgi:hypothetical protein
MEDSPTQPNKRILETLGRGVLDVVAGPTLLVVVLASDGDDAE